jgi:phosphoesterase RecJ-like protein
MEGSTTSTPSSPAAEPEAAGALVGALTACRRVLLTGPTAPDGDSLGACLALARELARRGGTAVLAGVVPARYRWMPGAERFVAEDLLLERGPEPFDAVVVLDGDRHRLHPVVQRLFAAAPVKGIVDHHASTRRDGYTHAWVEPRAESTCGMLARAMLRWDVPLDPELAAVLYTGLLFDTGGFRHSNTRPDTLRLAARLLEALDGRFEHDVIAVRVLCERTPGALLAMGRILGEVAYHEVPSGLRVAVARATQAIVVSVDGDLEGVVDAVLNTVGTDVGALLVERGPGSVKYSLRSRGSVDVARLAARLHPTGGGHPRAAGASFRGSLDQAEARLIEAISEERR